MRLVLGRLFIWGRMNLGAVPIQVPRLYDSSLTVREKSNGHLFIGVPIFKQTHCIPMMSIFKQTHCIPMMLLIGDVNFPELSAFLGAEHTGRSLSSLKFFEV
jgi:hypothetical protein